MTRHRQAYARGEDRSLRPSPDHAERSGRHRAGTALLLVVGTVLPQAFLFGPSLTGAKILLPLDLLKRPGVYLPASQDATAGVSGDVSLLDEIVYYEPARRFAAREFRAGRLPLWTPYIYAGAPFAVWAKYSPYNVLYYAFPSPKTLPWIQLVQSLVAATGAYLFFRMALSAGRWPALIGAWVYPLTGYFVLWQVFPATFVVSWLPWLLLAAECAVLRPAGWGGPALAIATALTLLSGPIDIAGQQLLACGIYAVWRLVQLHAPGSATRLLPRAAAVVVAAWILGFLLAAPYVLPLVEYARTGVRAEERAAGKLERPPLGLGELPQIVLPEVYGTTQPKCVRLVPVNRQESSAATYTGLVATLFLAPLAWSSRRHWGFNALWAALAFVALSWTLDVPGMVTILGRWPLNMMSHNRFVFVAAFALLALAVTGLDAPQRARIDRRWWFALPIAALIALGAWCFYRASVPPEALTTQLNRRLASGVDSRQIAEIGRTFLFYYAGAAVLCLIALVAWIAVAVGASPRRWSRGIVIVWLFELLWHAHGVSPQVDPSLYYPRLPVLEQLSSVPERVMTARTLPANLHEMLGLRDVLGYDGVDPKRVVEVLELAADPQYKGSLNYARVQWYMPKIFVADDGEIKLPGVLDMLGVRYVVFQGEPPEDFVPAMQGDGYWVIENPGALPRAWVPARVERVDEEHALRRLAVPEFDPRAVAYTTRALDLPAHQSGSAAVLSEVPGRVTLALNMETPGLVVLADSWDPGWSARIDGRPVEITRINHMLRGVVAPAGSSTLEFRYRPASVVHGGEAMAVGLAALALWMGALARARHRSSMRRDSN